MFYNGRPCKSIILTLYFFILYFGYYYKHEYVLLGLNVIDEVVCMEEDENKN